MAEPPFFDGHRRHGRVVGTQRQRRDEQLRPLLPDHLLERRAERRWRTRRRRPPACEPRLPQGLAALPASTSTTACWKLAARSALSLAVRCGPRLQTLCAVNRVQHRRLQPLKLKSSRSSCRNGRGKAMTPADCPPRGLALDGGPAGKAEAEQARHLVERLAGRVVDACAPSSSKSQRRPAMEQGRVPAADDQADARKDVAARGEPAGVDVAPRRG